MRKRGETLCVGIAEQHGDRQGRKLESKRVQLVGGQHEHRTGDGCENHGKAQGQLAGGKRAHFRSRIQGIKFQVRNTVESHGRAARTHHGDNQPEDLAPRGPAVNGE